MRQATYEKISGLSRRYHGYMRTEQLLAEGITNRQIAVLRQEDILERITVGIYWVKCDDIKKPEDYKMIEVSLGNENAIICADSACFLQGLIYVEPKVLSIATRRSDRKQMSMNFQIARHFYSDASFEQDYHKVQTKFGAYKVYDIDRSVCDCIRFRNDIDQDIFELVIESYRKSSQRQTDRLLEYAEKMRVNKQAHAILGE